MVACASKPSSLFNNNSNSRGEEWPLLKGAGQVLRGGAGLIAGPRCSGLPGCRLASPRPDWAAP